LAAAIKVFAVDIDGTLTENGGGMVHLAALAKLRYLEKMGYNVIYATGRSSIEAYVLAVFGGTTRIAIGENGGVVTIGAQALGEQGKMHSGLRSAEEKHRRRKDKASLS
jgi:hydroxymethylpyrimidine pyrophosphatase-like HAD family hydrolase